MQIEIPNRYGHPIVFTKLNPDQYIMSNGQWLRFGRDNGVKWEDNKFTFVDPSGGPYIAKGMSMGYVHQPWLGKIVQYCSMANRVKEIEDVMDFKDNDVLIVTYPLQIVKAVVNNKQVFRVYSEKGLVIETLDTFNDAVKWIEDQYDERRQTS
jgi:hypothetical protein